MQDGFGLVLRITSLKRTRLATASDRRSNYFVIQGHSLVWMWCKLTQWIATSTMHHTQRHQVTDVADSLQVDSVVVRQSESNAADALRVSLSAVALRTLFIDVWKRVPAAAARPGTDGRGQERDAGRTESAALLQRQRGQRRRMQSAAERHTRVKKETETVTESTEELQSAASHQQHISF